VSILELAFASGQLAALQRPKIAWLATTHPVVQESGLLKSQPSAKPPSLPPPPSSPAVVSETFDRHEQGETRTEPRRKLSADICTSCRKEKHYGTCKNPIPIKRADFNLGMTADTSTDNPSTSPHYHSATSADSSLARARDGRPAVEQAATGFADLFRNLGIANQADQAGNLSAALSKVSQFLLPGSETHSMHEQRGPSPNPYEERLQIKSPPIGQGYVGDQAVTHAFGQIDGAVDTTNIEGSSAPTPGPLA